MMPENKQNLVNFAITANHVPRYNPGSIWCRKFKSNPNLHVRTGVYGIKKTLN